MKRASWAICAVGVLLAASAIGCGGGARDCSDNLFLMCPPSAASGAQIDLSGMSLQGKSTYVSVITPDGKSHDGNVLQGDDQSITVALPSGLPAGKVTLQVVAGALCQKCDITIN
jgi:hypothetical protein